MAWKAIALIVLAAIVGTEAGKLKPLILSKSLSKNVVWIHDTFDNNFGIENDFDKYLKGSCW